MFTVEQLDLDAARQALPELVAVLQDCVEGGASIGFVIPLEPAIATAFWEDVFADLTTGYRFLLVARQENRIVGTAQLSLASKPNGVHRAEVQKVMVHRDAREQGIGKALMITVEELAKQHGRTLLVLDTVPGYPAEKLYRKLGYEAAGIVPQYAIHVDQQRVEPTLFMYKILQDWQPNID